MKVRTNVVNKERNRDEGNRRINRVDYRREPFQPFVIFFFKIKKRIITADK